MFPLSWVISIDSSSQELRNKTSWEEAPHILVPPPSLFKGYRTARGPASTAPVLFSPLLTSLFAGEASGKHVAAINVSMSFSSTEDSLQLFLWSLLCCMVLTFTGRDNPPGAWPFSIILEPVLQGQVYDQVQVCFLTPCICFLQYISLEQGLRQCGKVGKALY